MECFKCNYMAKYSSLYGFPTTLINLRPNEPKKSNNVLHRVSTLSCHLIALETLSTCCNKFCKLLSYSLNFVKMCISKHRNTNKNDQNGISNHRPRLSRL